MIDFVRFESKQCFGVCAWLTGLNPKWPLAQRGDFCCCFFGLNFELLPLSSEFAVQQHRFESMGTVQRCEWSTKTMTRSSRDEINDRWFGMKIQRYENADFLKVESLFCSNS